MANTYPNPCDTCKETASCKHSYGCAATVCDIPCPAYLRWYDTRMRIARKKVHL